MRITTQTLENGNVLAKGGNRQRTVKGVKHGPSLAHANAVSELLNAHGIALSEVIDNISANRINDNRMVWTLTEN